MHPLLSTTQHPYAHRPMQRRAFTLIELLVVVSIIVIMMSLAVPAFNAIRAVI